MPKAGKYEYPFFDLNSTTDKTKKIHEGLRENEMERGAVADILGMSISGGGFAYLVSSMEKYGLVKTGSGKVTLTDIGKLALYGNDAEKKQALNAAALNVELFKELYSQYGKNVTGEQIKAFLRQKAFVAIVKAQKLAPSVDKIYKNVANYITSADTPLESQKSESEGKGRREEMPITIGQSLEIKYRGVHIQIPPDDIEAIEFAEKALAFMKQQVKEKQKAES